MPPPLFLLEPDATTPIWAPFAGARPLAELRAGDAQFRQLWKELPWTDK